MKGVLLAGGTGSRLRPVTAVTNKHLLPVYDRPMIYWPLEVLRANGIRQVLVVTGREHAGAVFALLGSGHELGFDFTFRVQDEADGIAAALALAEPFIVGDGITPEAEAHSFLAVLGDNVFLPPPAVPERLPVGAARVWLKHVPDPGRYGVPYYRKDADGNDRLAGIVEKPADPPSPYAVTGLYQYDEYVFEVIRRTKPSLRGELEISAVNNDYVAGGALDWVDLGDAYWGDCGASLHGLLEVSGEVRRELTKQALGPRSA